MYVLDTNTLIYFFKGMGHVAENMLYHSPQEIGLPSIVLYEIEVGIGKSTSPQKRTEQLAELVSVVNILPFGLNEAKVAAQIRVNLELNGLPIGYYDTLIAATTLANRGILITHNTKEFSRVEKLNIADWY